MPANVLVPEPPIWIHRACDAEEIVEAWVELPQTGRFEGMRFRPMRTTLVGNKDILELLAYFFEWPWKCVGSALRGVKSVQ